MKVEQKKAKFSPITITLETEEEARALGYYLGCADDKTFVHYLEDQEQLKSDARGEIREIVYEIFSKYEDVYDVDNDC